MDVFEAIQKRKSIRAYLDRPVPADELEKIIEAGRWAPNAGPFHLSVIRNADLRQRINDRTLNAMVNSGIDFLLQRASLPGYQPLYGAPVLILISAPGNAPYSAMNAALAAENMLLEATGLSLGSCYLVSPTLAMNSESSRDLAGEAGIPDGYELKCAVIVGYAAAENRFAVGERTIKGSVSYIE
jgi:FMN reductase [NAD(P)H]